MNHLHFPNSYYDFQSQCLDCLVGLYWSRWTTHHWLRRPKILTILNRVTGGMFILFGARLALERKEQPGSLVRCRLGPCTLDSIAIAVMIAPCGQRLPWIPMSSAS